MPTVHVLIIRDHPDRPDLVLLDTPPELAPIMGRFQPARYAGLAHGAYILPVDQLGNLETFTRANHLGTIDDRGRDPRTTPTPGALNPLPECATCGQPSKRERPVRYCPACGALWHPVYPRQLTRELAEITCQTCSTVQRSGFPRCLNCGELLPNEPKPRQTLATRQQLADPLPLAVTIDETLAQQAGT